MRLMSLLLLAVVPSSCRCSEGELRLVDAAPTTSAPSAASAAALSLAASLEDVEWTDATNHPDRVEKLCGTWGDKKPWAKLDCVRAWQEDHPKAKKWPHSFTHYLTVRSDDSVECGFFSDQMEESYCRYTSNSKKQLVVPLKLEFWNGKNERRARITAGKSQPVVVVRHALP